MTTDAARTARDELAATLEAMQATVLNRMNVDFEDSVLLVGRVLGGRPHATAARLDHIGLDGVRGTVVDAEGEHPMELSYETITNDIELTDRLMGLVALAREQSGEEGMTTAEREVASVSSLRTFVTAVVAVEEVHPHLRRITFGGGDLDAFEPAGPDTFLYLLLPPPGRAELTIDQSFTWEAYGEMPDAERPVGAYYTLRRWDPVRSELEMLFVLHEPAGPASEWAARAQPGDPVALWGPRTAFHPPEGTERYLLVADETGLPAVASILDVLPHGIPVLVLAEVADETERQELPIRAGITVTWLHRDGREAGTTTLLADAAAALEPLGSGTYVWGGGESRAMTGVRKIVRQGWGLPREGVSLVAYWRHATHAADPVDEE